MVEELTVADVECEEIQHHGDVTMYCKLEKGHARASRDAGRDIVHQFRFVKDGKDFTYPAWPVKKKEK